MNWLKAIAEAPSLEELVAVVNDFLVHQVDEFWSWIPKGFRPPLMSSEEDIHEWHHRLADELSCIDAPNIRLQDLCVVFVRASAHAHELRAPHDGNPSSNDREFGSGFDHSRGRPPR